MRTSAIESSPISDDAAHARSGRYEQPDRFRAWLRQRRLDPGYLARVAFVSTVMLIWGMLSVGSLVGEFIRGEQQKAAGIPASTSDRTLGGPSFHDLMRRAGAVCPAGRPLLLVADAGAAYKLSDYFFFPRKTISIERHQTFGSRELAGQVGACVANYGAVSGQRLEPFRHRLDEVMCSREGCFYFVR